MQKKILDHIAHIAHISSWRLPLRFLSPWTAFHRRRRRHVYEARWRWWLERSTAKAGNIEIMWKYVKICESYCSWLGWFSELSGVDFWLLDKCWGNYQTILASKSLQHCLNTIRFFHISHTFPGKVPETLAKPSQWAISNSFFFPGWASRRAIASSPSPTSKKPTRCREMLGGWDGFTTPRHGNSHGDICSCGSWFPWEIWWPKISFYPLVI